MPIAVLGIIFKGLARLKLRTLIQLDWLAFKRSWLQYLCRTSLFFDSPCLLLIKEAINNLKLRITYHFVLIPSYFVIFHAWFAAPPIIIKWLFRRIGGLVSSTKISFWCCGNATIPQWKIIEIGLNHANANTLYRFVSCMIRFYFPLIL